MDSDHPEEPRRLPWWIRWVLYPVGWFGGALSGVVLLGFVLLWRFPGLAGKHDVELRDLIARAIDPHWGDPFYVLKGRADWEKYRFDWEVADDGQKIGGKI